MTPRKINAHDVIESTINDPGIEVEHEPPVEPLLL